MYAREMIEKYFSHHNDHKFDVSFRENAGIFHLEDSIYCIEELDDNSLAVFFENIMKFYDKPIIKNGVRVGAVTLAEPHTILVRRGTFICRGINNFKRKPIETNSRKRGDISISKNIFPGRLTVGVNNSHIHCRVSCKLITPGSFESKTYN